MANGVMDSGAVVGVTSENLPLEQPAMSPVAGEWDDGDSYRPVPMLAPLALFLGVCSSACLIGWVGLPIGLVGVVVGWLACRSIAASEGEYGGAALARTGLAMSAVFLLGGAAFHSYVYATEVPEGYERVWFEWLARQAPITDEHGVRLHEEVQKLHGKKIFIKGYMYPTRQLTGLREFVLVKDNGDCCFGGQPKITDMIVVKFVPGIEVNYRDQQLVAVAGTFRAAEVVQSGELTAVYSLEGTHFK